MCYPALITPKPPNPTNLDAELVALEGVAAATDGHHAKCVGRAFQLPWQRQRLHSTHITRQ